VLPGGAILWDRFQRFRAELSETCHQARQRPEELTFAEYIRYVDGFRPSKDDVLTLSDDNKTTNPTPVQIRQALKRLPGGGDSFAIYQKGGSGLSYMQTSGGPEEGFILEYQAGSLDAHFVCANRALSFEEIVQSFTWYATGDERWRTDISWEPVEL
jgi:hypothetical protein